MDPFCATFAIMPDYRRAAPNGGSCGKHNPSPRRARRHRKERSAGELVTGSTWWLADGEHGGNQVVPRPGQVVLGDQDNPVIDAKMVDRPPGSGR